MFKDLPDPRVVRRCAHELSDVLLIAVCCLLCGGETFYDMERFGEAKHAWLKTFLTLPNGIPRPATFNRVFAALKPAAFPEGFLRWTQSVRQTSAGEIVAVDGKALRRAGAKSQCPRYIVSAWASANRLVLGQLKVADKSNEITAVCRGWSKGERVVGAKGESLLEQKENSSTGPISGWLGVPRSRGIAASGRRIRLCGSAT